MNAFALSGLGVTVTPDQISTVASGAASLDPKKSAVTGAIVGTQVLPIIGTAIGAAIGYIGAGIAKLFQKAQYTFSKEVKGGLNYMTATHIESNQKASILIYGIPRTVFCKCPLIGSCNTCRDGFEVFLMQLAGGALNKFLENPQAFVKDPLKFGLGTLDHYVINTVKSAGLDINNVPTFIYEDGKGLILAAVGGQLYSNAPEQKQQSNQVSTQQAGFGWVVGLLGLSVVGGLIWKASQKKKTA